MNPHQREIEVTVPGAWDARPADRPDADWTPVTRTPAKVRLADGEVYRLRVDQDVTDEQLQGLASLRGVPGLEALEMNSCYQATDAGLAHLRDLTQLRRLDIQWCQAVTDA